METEDASDRSRMTEPELLERFRKTLCSHCFEEIVDRYSDLVYASCSRVLFGAPEDRDDAVQATFLALFQQAQRLRSDTNLGAWLHRVAVLSGLKMLRARRRVSREKELVSRGADGKERLAEDDDWAAVRPHLDGAICALPTKYREVVVLRYLEGLTRREMARRLGCTEGTVRTRLTRALRKLRSKLSGHAAGLSIATLASFLGERIAEKAPSEVIRQIIAVCEQPSQASAMVMKTALAVGSHLYWSSLAPVLVAVAGLLTLAVAIPVASDLRPDKELETVTAHGSEPAWLDYRWDFSKGPPKDFEVLKGAWHWQAGVHGQGEMTATDAILVKLPASLSRRAFRLSLKQVGRPKKKEPMLLQAVFLDEGGHRKEWKNMWRDRIELSEATSIDVWVFESHAIYGTGEHVFALTEFTEPYPGRTMALAAANLSMEEITLCSVATRALPEALREPDRLKERMKKYREGDNVHFLEQNLKD